MNLQKSKKRWWLVVVMVVVLLSVLAGYVAHQSSPLMPDAIRKQASFVIFYPNTKSQFVVDRKKISYNPDPDYKALTFTAKSSDTTLDIVEQATPSNFSDIPQLYDKFIEKLNAYTSFDSSHGKVTLTRPPKRNNKQYAILNTQGTLLLIGADKDLSDDQWRQFFNGLQSISP